MAPETFGSKRIVIPVIGLDDVLVQVKASGVCGSDVHRYLGTDYGRGYYNYLMNSGHEYCGDVVQTGNRVKGFREGERVTLGASWVSGKLGAFSEYVHLPNAANGSCRLPQEITYTNGALIESFLVAMNSYHRRIPCRMTAF